MAKVQVSDALSVLADFGIEFTAAQKKAIAEAQAKAMLQPALNIFMGDGENLPGKCVEKSEDKATEWVNRSFELADLVSLDMVGVEKSVQGGAKRIVRMFGIDTPHGHLKVELRSE